MALEISESDEPVFAAKLVHVGMNAQAAAEHSANIVKVYAKGLAMVEAKSNSSQTTVELVKVQQKAFSRRDAKRSSMQASSPMLSSNAGGFKSVGNFLDKPERFSIRKLEAPSPNPIDEVKAKVVNKAAARSTTNSPKIQNIVSVFNYSTGKVPNRIRDLIDACAANEEEGDISAKAIGFMTRSLVMATLPHKRYEGHAFERKNGNFNLTMMTAHPEGLPFGVVPRMLLMWVCAEAVRTRDCVLRLDNSLLGYLSKLGFNSTGSEQGDVIRLKHTITTLFGAVISCRYEGVERWALLNVLLADRIEWQQPHNSQDHGSWQARLHLSKRFFTECIDHPIPIDIRAMHLLRPSSLALDIYVWLTYRMGYPSCQTIIPWTYLQGQFGSNHDTNERGEEEFKSLFLSELKQVLAVCPRVTVQNMDVGLAISSIS